MCGRKLIFPWADVKARATNRGHGTRAICWRVWRTGQEEQMIRESSTAKREKEKPPRQREEKRHEL